LITPHTFKKFTTDNITSLYAVNNIGNGNYFDGSFSLVNTAELAFTHNENKVKVNIGWDQNGNYIFDMDGDKAIDLQVVPVTSDYSEIIYLDEEGNKISKAKAPNSHAMPTRQIHNNWHSSCYIL
jgi:hypothetical protein